MPTPSVVNLIWSEEPFNVGQQSCQFFRGEDVQFVFGLPDGESGSAEGEDYVITIGYKENGPTIAVIEDPALDDSEIIFDFDTTESRLLPGHREYWFELRRSADQKILAYGRAVVFGSPAYVTEDGPLVTIGSQGWQGWQGIQGNQGSGIQGYQGSQGLSIQGFQGNQGFQSNQGYQGVPGPAPIGVAGDVIFLSGTASGTVDSGVFNYDAATDTLSVPNIVGQVTGNAATVTGLNVAPGKSLTVNNILTLSGADGSALAIGAGGALGTAAFTASSAYDAAGSAASAQAASQPADADLTTWAGLTPSVNAQSLVTAANYAAMRTLLDLEAGTDFYSISATDTFLALKAPLASPLLTGVPTAPTAAATTNTTQIATTAFVQQELATAVAGLLDFKGNIDASANPNYPSGSKGDTYYINVAGKVGGASGKSVDVGDAVIANVDNAGGTEASVGTSWFVLEHNLAGALLAANNLSDVANAGTARTSLGLGIGDSPTFSAVAATTFTGALTGTASGNLVSGGAAGTPSSINLANGTALPISGLTASTSAALGVGSLELGHATDTTFSRSAAGKVAVEGKAVPLMSGASNAIFAGPTATRTYTFPDADTTLGAALTGANPSASVGLTVVNGSASTFLRSDGAPALDQAAAFKFTALDTTVLSPIARSSGVAAYLTVNAPADTSLTTLTEAIGVNFVGATRKHANGSITTQREVVFGAPTYDFASGSNTITNAATVAIAAAPSSGSFASITNPYALWVQAGNVRFDGSLGLGTTLASPTYLVDLATSTLVRGINLAMTTAGTTNYSIFSIVSGVASGYNVGLYLDVSGATTGNRGIQVNVVAGTNNRAIYTTSTAISEFGGGLNVSAGASGTIAGVFVGAASRTVPILQLQNNAAASLGSVGGTIFNSFTDTSTTSTNGTEDDLYSYTTVANTFAINGDSILQIEHVQFVSSATAARRLKKYFAGTLIFDSGALTLTLGGDFVLETVVIRESSTIVRCSVNVVTTSASSIPYATYTRITGLTLTSTNVLKSTGIASGTGAASGDIVDKLSKVTFQPAA